MQTFPLRSWPDWLKFPTVEQWEASACHSDGVYQVTHIKTFRQQKHQDKKSSPSRSFWESLCCPLNLLKSDLITLALPKRLKRVRTFSWYHSKVPILRTLFKGNRGDRIGSDLNKKFIHVVPNMCVCWEHKKEKQAQPWDAFCAAVSCRHSQRKHQYNGYKWSWNKLVVINSSWWSQAVKETWAVSV